MVGQIGAVPKPRLRHRLLQMTVRFTDNTPMTPPDATILPVVDEEPLPEQTDNSVKPEDGDQDVNQDPTPTPGSPA